MNNLEKLKELVLKLKDEKRLDKDEWMLLIESQSPELMEFASEYAREVREAHYGKDVYVRGLIEISNYCRNDCYYCGIRKSNLNAHRYRLSKETILECCREGHELGYRTFVMQGGEDMHYSDDLVCDIVSSIKAEFPDSAVTLSIGERSRESYARFKEAGADRYLLRHETACEAHYRRLHPDELTLANRKRCLYDLKELGFQVGAGFMVGAPYQTVDNLAEDMIFLKELNPHMVGIGPFIPHHDTPFKDMPAGSAEQTLYLLSLTRLMLPSVLLPATTALGTISDNGRELGMLAGANVVMPNLSPAEVRGDYLLYDNKLCTGDEAAQNLANLRKRMESVGFNLSVTRGDWKE